MIAAKSGADRLELCTNLEEGGTTPDWEMVKMARQKISIPLYIMIRPRGGNFIYSNEEFEQMKTE
ncbi:MAG: copper homeostasis protein CutC, partial [Bacteroidia bacterium]